MLGTVSIQNIGRYLDVHSLGVASGYLGAALGVGMVVPQIARTYRNRDIPGVSAMSWALTALGCLTWLLYGVRTGEVPQIPGNVLIVSGSVVVVLAVPSVTSLGRRAAQLVGAALALAGLAAVLPPIVLGFVALAIGLVAGLPQTIKSLTRPRHEASAVSLLAWVLRAASQVCWLLYALALHDTAVTVSSLLIFSSALVLIVSELSRGASVPIAAEITAPACAVG